MKGRAPKVQPSGMWQGLLLDLGWLGVVLKLRRDPGEEGVRAASVVSTSPAPISWA